MNKTKIDWTDYSWNPITGCRNNCEYCYARKIATRFGGHWNEKELRHFGADGEIHDLEKPMCRHTRGKNRDIPIHTVAAPYPYGFDPTFHRYRLDRPQKIKKPQTVFVCSMADLFGDWVPDEWINEVFEACEKAPQHRYLFLTKNPDRYAELYEKGILPQNEIWLGTTITSPDDEFILFREPSCRSFVSIEPILKPFGKMTGAMPKWVIIGAETGNRKGKVVPKREWIEEIVEDCKLRNVPVFMKESLEELMGQDFIQEFPW